MMWHRKKASSNEGKKREERGDAPERWPAPAQLAKHMTELGVEEIELHDPPGVEKSAPTADQAGTLPGPRGIWSMGLVVTASALCGGIAVVLWNRRLLTKMRDVAPVKREEYQAQQGRLWEDDV